MRKKTEQSEDTLADPGAAPRLSPMDIQQKEFSVTRVGGGYRMRDVDEFLDQLTTSMTSLVEENRRLREQAGSGAMIGAPDLEAVSRQADEIIRRARDEAAQIVREAKTAATVAGAAAEETGVSDADRAQISAFLLREREFLQSIAGLVQGHAEAVKGMVKDARARPASAAAPPPSGPQPVSTAPQEEQPAPAAVPIEAPTGELPEPVRVDDPEPEPAPAPEPEPEPATLSRADTDDDAEQGDTSLRELFWGEE